MTNLPPDVLARFSPRARVLLSRAKPFSVERDPAVVAAKLAALGWPVWKSVLDFQSDIAGLEWPSNRLAIEFREREILPEEDDPRHLEATMVPIGSVEGDGDATAYMNEAGEVFSNFGRRSSSVTKYIEQAALAHGILSERESEDRPRFFVGLRPTAGDAFAEALSLSGNRVEEASDAYEQWWADGRVLLRHRSYDDDVCARQDIAITSSLADAVHVLSRAHSVSSSLLVDIGAQPMTNVKLSPEEAAKVPDEHSWRGTRYAFGNATGHGDGSVWVVGEGEALQVHAYIKYDGQLYYWITVDTAGATCRTLPRQPWQPRQP